MLVKTRVADRREISKIDTISRRQTFNATSISHAAQQARRDAGELARRADNLLRLTVADGPGRSANAVRRFRIEQASMARELAAIFNDRVASPRKIRN